MTFPGSGSKPVGAFSGLYQVISCMNSFSGGTFTQQLSLIRRRNQPGLDTNALPVSTGNQIVEEAVEDTTTTTTGGTSAGGSDTGNVGNTEDNLLMNQNQEEREFDIELNEGVT